MRKAPLILAGLALLISKLYAGGKLEYEKLTEEAIVLQKEYESDYTLPSFNGKSIVMVYYPEEFNITFDGEIDFTVDNEEIYNRFNEGDSAEVNYEAVYSLIKDMDGTIKRKFKRYKFLDAILKPEQ